MRYVIYITIAFLSAFCFIKAEGQGVSVFGASRPQDTSKTKGQIVGAAYANTNVLLFLTADASGHFILDTVITNVDSSIFATLFRMDTVKNNIRSEIATKIPYTDTGSFLPTKTFLAQNYFAQGGNTFGTTGVLGTNGANHLDIETNNTTRLRIFSNGNAAIGTTTDNGYKLQVAGTLNATDDISYIKTGVTTTLTTSSVGNYIYSRISAPGALGGFRGGVVLATGTNGAAVTNKYFFANNGTVGFGAGTASAVENADETSLLINNTTAAPAGTYGGNTLRLYTDDINKYTVTNGKIYAALVMGAEVGGSVPGTGTSNNTTVGIGYQYRPVANGWASELILFGRDEDNNFVNLAQFYTGDKSLTLEGFVKTAQPTASGAGEVKFGKILTGSDTNKYLEIEVDGVDYYIMALTALP